MDNFPFLHFFSLNGKLKLLKNSAVFAVVLMRLAVHFGLFDIFQGQFEGQFDKISTTKDSFQSNLDPNSAQTSILNILKKLLLMVSLI